MSDLRPGLFFFHNPKAGGTALASRLAARFPESERAPLIENHRTDHESLAGDYAAFAGYRYYGGHYGADVWSAVRTDHVAVTNFRHPVDRVRSLYNFFRFSVVASPEQLAEQAFAAVSAAKRLDLRSFVTSDDRDVQMYISNFHVRQLSSTPWDPTRSPDLGSAVDLVESMPWFYVCEEPEASRRWGRDLFGSTFDQIDRENVTVAADASSELVHDVDEATAREIELRNADDLELHALALDRVLSAFDPRR